jgi:putative SOS response-associated peptidase YedK
LLDAHSFNDLVGAGEDLRRDRAKDIKVGFANINAKAEGIENRAAFREAFQRRRCLVPVGNFYEWKKTPTGKQPYAIP